MSLLTSQQPIRLSWIEEGIAVIAMEDRASRNRFSPEFIAGVETAFAEVAAREEARAVVIHGYDHYFCCGGTREELALLASGKAAFTDFPFFDSLLRCPVPVIAAMQGHAIGGGFVFGLYADIVVLGQECLYNTNFMQYGFTPGMGATWVLPTRLGSTLGWEMLFSARNYHGGELRERGAPVQVVPKREVIPHAIAQAREIALKSPVALRELKKAYTASVCVDHAAAVQREVAMHAVTFTRPEVLERIATLYPE